MANMGMKLDSHLRSNRLRDQTRKQQQQRQREKRYERAKNKNKKDHTTNRNPVRLGYVSWHDSRQGARDEAALRVLH